MIRSDSVVTVDTEGVVGEYVSDDSRRVAKCIDRAGWLCPPEQAPVNMSDLLTNGLGVMNDADTNLKQVTGKLNATLDSANVAMGNANDVLVGVKEGRGPAGMLLRDEKMASQIRETLSTVQTTTLNLKQASVGVNSMLADIQQRQFPQKIDDTMTQIHSVSTQANAAIGEVHQSLTQSLGPDANGVTAAQNISQSLSNANVTTSNMAEDTEAIKHNFFFKSFFKHRGYYNLSSLTPSEYRRSKLFASPKNSRVWLRAEPLFQHGTEGLSEDGKRAIDAAVISFGDSIFTHPIVVEGYSDAAAPADALSSSYVRAETVRNYLVARYPFEAKNVGVMSLSATAPTGLGHDHWSGVCILVAEKK